MSDSNPQFPGFLDLIDSDPKGCAIGFFIYARSLFQARPPRLTKSLDRLTVDDLVMEVVQHCITDDFKVLRQYEPIGRPFAVWLYMVFANKALDLLRSRKYNPQIGQSVDEKGEPIEQIDRSRLPGNRPSTQSGQDSVRIVSELLSQLDEECRVLLRFAAEEYRPREISLVMGQGSQDAKRLSDRLGYCRRKLLKMLQGIGLTVVDLFSGA